MTVKYQQYFGQIPITDSSKDFTVSHGPTAGALTEGLYFCHGWTGETTDQLIEHWQAVIRALHANVSLTEVTYSYTTGLITVLFKNGGGTPVNTDITWNDADLQTLLGFTGAQAGATTYTATNSPRGVWRPTYGLSQYPGDLTEWWEDTSSSITARADSGVTYTAEGDLTYGGTFIYSMLPDADVITDSATVWESWEKFFDTVIHKGYRFRCYPDRTLNAAANVKEAVFANESGVAGNMGSLRMRSFERVNGWWNVTLPLWKYVAG